MKWRPRWWYIVVRRHVVGLLTTKCYQCGGPKKRNTWRNCPSCQLKNLRTFMEEE